MVLCFTKRTYASDLSHKHMMFARNSLGVDAQLAHSATVMSHSVKQESLPTSPTTAPVTLITAQMETGDVIEPNSTLEATNSGRTSTASHTPTSYDIVSGTSAIENSSGTGLSACHQSQPHYLPAMYSSFVTNNPASSALVMTPPSPYGSEMSNSMVSTESPLLTQHSSWYHHSTAMRAASQHHSAYQDLMSGEWSNSVCANSSFGAATSSPLPPYQMPSLQTPYPTPMSSVYHSSCRAAGSIDFYDSRFNNYPYYSNAFSFGSGSPGTPSGHAFAPLTVGTDINAIQYAQGTINNSSPDSGLTVSSEGNESPLLNSQNGVEMHGTSGGTLNASLSSTSRMADLEVGVNKSLASRASVKAEPQDIKPPQWNMTVSSQTLPTMSRQSFMIKEISLQSGNSVQQSEQKSASSGSTNSSGSNSKSSSSNTGNSKLYNWMSKSSGSGQAQSSTGKTRTKDKYRVVYTENQRLELEKEFHYSRYITIKRKSELAGQLSLSERQVKIWFQNRRAKDRKQTRKKEELLKKEKEKEAAAAAVSAAAVSSSTNNSSGETNSTTGCYGNVAPVLVASGSSPGSIHAGGPLLASSHHHTPHHQSVHHVHHTVSSASHSHLMTAAVSHTLASGTHPFSTAAHHSALHSPSAHSSIIQNGYREILGMGAQGATG